MASPRSVFLFLVLALASGATGEPAAAVGAYDSVPSADGVRIVYNAWGSAGGSGRPALVFIHGGFADREFWREQVEPLAGDFQLVTLDLAGHGESGADRKTWSLDAFGDDVRAVVEALDLESVVLVGNSLGGPVALAAARKLPGVVRGVIAVDTFQDVDRPWPRVEREAYVQALRDDFPAVCQQMMTQLLLEDTDADLAAWVEERMCGFDPAIAPHVVSGFVDYDLAAAFAAAEVPIRAILGETVPLDLAGNRELQPEFDAVTMEGCGHYPMLERPGEFNRTLRAHVAELTTMEETMDQSQHDRRVDYVEFRTTDMEKTKAFYSKVFGWQFTDWGPDYASFADGRLTGGFEAASEVSSGGPLVVIYAKQLEAIEAQVREHGGQIVREIFEFPGGRRFHFADPSGNELAVWSDR